MSVTVSIYIEDIADRLESFDQALLYRDTVPSGDFSTLVATVPLVAHQRLYSVYDEDGTATSWYRYYLRNSITLDESPWSPPWRGAETTLGVVRLAAARACSAGFNGTATAGGATQITDDALRDVGRDPGFLSGAWVYRPGASADDRVRRLTERPFSLSDGSLVVTRAWNSSPQADEPYEVYQLAPPIDMPGTVYSWDKAVNDGLGYCWLEDEVFVATSVDTETRFSLDGLGIDPKYVVSVHTRDVGGGFETDYSKHGRFWRIDRNLDREDLVLSGAPMVGREIFLRATTRPHSVYRDSDLVTIPETLAYCAARLAMYRHLNSAPATAGKYMAETASAALEFDRAYEPLRPRPVVRI